jgi:hypothetical protein
MCINTTGKLGGCYFSLAFIFKIYAMLDFKNKSCAFGNNRLISPSYLNKNTQVA